MTADHQPRTVTLSPAPMSGPFIMFLSAAIFGYFGFGSTWAHKMTTDDPPELLIMVAVLEWTLKASSILFVLAALITMARAFAGNLLYTIVGLLSSLAFVAVAIWDFSTPYMSGIPPVLLLIFAAWNGYGSWTGLQAMLTMRVTPARTYPVEQRFDPPRH